MKKIFTLCLAGALALAATSCKEDKAEIIVDTITVNGQSYEVKTALYAEDAGDDEDEAALELGLFRDSFATPPHDEPDFYVGIGISESLYGRTIDLTKPVAKSGALEPYLEIMATGNGIAFGIEYYKGQIYVETPEPVQPAGLTVQEGSLKLTKKGDKFTVQMYVTLSDGKSASAGWSGTAIKANTVN